MIFSHDISLLLFELETCWHEASENLKQHGIWPGVLASIVFTVTCFLMNNVSLEAIR